MGKLLLHLFLLCPLICLLSNIAVVVVEGLDVYVTTTRRYEAIYQFGDSNSDTGNLVQLRPNTTTGKLPYGQTLGRPSNRSSDGLLMVDYFAMYFNLSLLNPYLANGSDFSHGANFAVAGGTALDFATLASKNITYGLANNGSLASQLSWYNSHLHTICSYPAECKEKLQKSLVIVGGIGGNDYSLALSQGGQTLEETYELVPEIVGTIIGAAEEVIKLGAVNVMVPGSMPRGCTPSSLVRYQTNDSSKYDDLQCLKDHNAFSRFHNNELRSAIRMLKLKYPGVNIVYGDYYSAAIWLLRNAASLGFDEDVHKTCCGAGDNPYNYDPNRSCGTPGSSVCPDPSKRVSWDGRHMTQQAFKYMANWLLNQFLPELSN